jgi:hypothetical protein
MRKYVKLTTKQSGMVNQPRDEMDATGKTSRKTRARPRVTWAYGRGSKEMARCSDSSRMSASEAIAVSMPQKVWGQV